MGRLTDTVQSLNVNNGISVYTITHFGINGFDLRSFNLSNNFSEGTSLRVGKSSIKSTNAYVYDENGKLEKPIVYSDFIGRLYHQNDDIKNPSFKFITEEGFSTFEKSIRELNLIDKKNNVYYDFPLDDYEGNILGDFSLEKVPTVVKIGDEYSIGKTVLHYDHENLKDSGQKFVDKLNSYTNTVNNLIGNYGFSSGDEYYYKNIIPSNLTDSIGNSDVIVNYYDRIYYANDLLNSKDILKIGKEERDKYILRNYRYDFDYFSKNIGNGQSIKDDIGDRKYGDLEKITETTYLFANLGKFGLYSYYDNDRDISMGYNNGFYTNNKQYAVGPETEENKPFDYFSVNQKHKDFVNIVTKGKEGIPYKSDKVNSYMEHDNGNALGTSISFMPNSGSAVSGYSQLLQRTNNLFYNQRIGSLINRFHTSKVIGYDGKEVDVATEKNELITSKDDIYGMSRGRNLLTDLENINGYENPYCRVWTAHHQYGKISRLIRPFKENDKSITISKTQEMYKGSNLRPYNDVLSDNTVLLSDGFVRITPSNDEDFYDKDSNKNIKSYMFSIENLAWRDIHTENVLSKEQRGPNGGRIMWFPPYNLKFTENVNVDWNANKFIGRGEQIYTYTNTNRNGTLDFTLLIDHPSIINKWRGTSSEIDEGKHEQEILRFFAGCETLEGNCGNGVNNSNENNDTITTLNNNPTYEGKDKKIALVLFFPNNFSGHDYKGKDGITEAVELLRSYEDSTDSGSVWTNKEDEDIENQFYQNINRDGYNLNYEPTPDAKKRIRELLFGGDENIDIYSFFDSNYGYDKLDEMIGDVNSEDGSIFKINEKNIRIDLIEAKGFASSHGFQQNNLLLCDRRRDFIEAAVLNKCNKIEAEKIINERGKIIEMNDVVSGEDRDINKIEAKISRCGILVFRIKWNENTTTYDYPSEDAIAVVNGQNYDYVDELNTKNNLLPEVTITESSQEDYSCDNEYLYFSNLRNEELAYQSIVERIRYFNPAYHSITPEGFNSRLTFLHQCTRQGPTLDLSSGIHNESSKNYVKYAGNLSFGRAPYCILRIGDFFNTKICINSISINYDNNGSVQWDLNPEGVGVQPMFANVSISFTFIGGQDIAGPIERLQNAVTSNYYANASVYDSKADRKGDRNGRGSKVFIPELIKN